MDLQGIMAEIKKGVAEIIDEACFKFNQKIL